MEDKGAKERQRGSLGSCRDAVYRESSSGLAGHQQKGGDASEMGCRGHLQWKGKDGMLYMKSVHGDTG